MVSYKCSAHMLTESPPDVHLHGTSAINMELAGSTDVRRRSIRSPQVKLTLQVRLGLTTSAWLHMYCYISTTR